MAIVVSWNWHYLEIRETLNYCSFFNMALTKSSRNIKSFQINTSWINIFSIQIVSPNLIPLDCVEGMSTLVQSIIGAVKQ